jgi:hypothetical protein
VGGLDVLPRGGGRRAAAVAHGRAPGSEGRVARVCAALRGWVADGGRRSSRAEADRGVEEQ